MAQYPVDTPDGLYEAVNYLASGPSGLGQNFAGFSSYATAYLTGNFRIPFTQPGPANLYVPNIALGVSEMLDGRTWKFWFASTQPTPPFSPGNIITVTGVSDPYYDGTYSPIGVVSCTVDYVITRTNGTYALAAPSSGGDVYLNTSGFMSTDCNARVTVTGGTDRVFISAQLDNLISYTVTTGTDDLIYTVAVNRYKGYINNDPINPDYIFDLDGTVASKTYTYSGLSGSGSLSLNESVFTSLLDQPGPSYYWYILEVEFTSTGGNASVTSCEFGLRSLSAQVVKQ